MARSKYYNSTTQQWEYADRNPLPTGQNGDILVNENGVWVAKPKWRMSFQLVEWIESVPSSSGPYIDTGYVPTSKTVIEAEVAFTDSSETAGKYMGMRHWKTTSDTRALFFGRRYSNNTPSLALFTMYPEATPEQIEYDSDFHHYLITPTLQKIDDNEFHLNYSTFPDDETLSFILFGLHAYYENQQYPSVEVNLVRCKLKYLRIKEGDILVRNFIPVYDIYTGEIGVYETVGDRFYGNEVTNGSFNKGADVN